MAVKKSVGLRELKNRLSEYVRRVRAGHRLLITDRGQVVAELRPPGDAGADPGSDSGLAQLVKRGSLSPGAPNNAGLYPSMPRLLPAGTVGRLLDEERGGR